MSVQKLQCLEKPFCMYCFNEYTMLNTDEGKAECEQCKLVVNLSEYDRNNFGIGNCTVKDEITTLVEDLDRIYSQIFKKCEHPRIKAIRSMNDSYY